MTDAQILNKINKLGKQLQKEVAEVEKQGYQVTALYNTETNKDELFLVKDCTEGVE